jgi:hypothetical protein
MRYQIKAVWILALLDLVLQTSSFYWTSAPITRSIYLDERYITSSSDLSLQPARHESRRLSFALQAALTLEETTDVIRESRLLSTIVGHYVKDVKPKGNRQPDIS